MGWPFADFPMVFIMQTSCASWSNILNNSAGG